jgi:hypothetical protein
MPDKVFLSRIYLKCLQTIKNNPDNPTEIWTKYWTDTLKNKGHLNGHK